MTTKIKDTRTRAQRNRQDNQDKLREHLSKQQHITHIIKICEELNNPDVDMDAVMVTRKKTVIDTKLKLLNKYLPDLKAIEHTGEAGGDLIIKVANYARNNDSK